MKWPVSAIAFFPMVPGLAATNMPAFAANANPAHDAVICTAVQDRIARLACFDAAFHTPVPSIDGQRPIEDQATPPKAGPLRRLAERLERLFPYLLSTNQPTLNHGDNSFMITQKHGNRTSLEPQLQAGYELKHAAKVLVSVDGRKFAMRSQGNRAWLEDDAEERQLVELRTNTQYKYSLSGVSATLGAISQCK